MTLIDRVLSHSEFAHRPPVLVDIGASGGVHPHWRTVAKHCYCVAFDGDDREFGHAVVDSKDFKKLFLFHSLVVDGDQKETPFHLTASPFCSSTLPPDTKALSDWAFAPKFAVVKTVPVRSVSLNAALTQAGVSYVDWFKSDSQGTDLRLFRSLPENIRNGVLAVEFEPGFIDAYHGEDKLSDVLRFMEQEKFWLSDGVVKGSQRITPSDLVRISAHPWMQKMIAFSHRASPGWIEMTYLRSFDDDRTLRDHLLGWVIATVQQQYGFALRLATAGKDRFGDPLFTELETASIAMIRRTLLSGGILSAVKEKVLKMLHRA